MRQRWVDIAKALAIIAVVVGHIGYSWPNMKLLPMSTLFVWLWHVPVFFIIGGFFLKDEKLVLPVSFIKGKLKSLYLPLIYIYLPVLLLHNLFISIGFYDTEIEYYGKYETEWGVIDFLKNTVAALLCAGREPILGAMWFGFVLFLALCIISIVSWILNLIGKKWSEQKYEIIRGLIFLLLAVVSSLLTKVFNFTIPRFNNTLLAVWLIYIGMLLMRKAKIQFTSGYVCISCAIAAWYSSINLGGTNLVANEYGDLIALTITSIACLYVICYLSKLMEKHTWLKLVLSRIGRDSLYIMGLHFIGFKVATLLLNCFGFEANLAILVPDIGASFILFVYYSIFGVGIPLLVISIFRMIKKAVCRN